MSESASICWLPATIGKWSSKVGPSLLEKIWIGLVLGLFQFLEDSQVAFSVIVENVTKNGGQLVDLTRCRCGFGMDDAGIHVLNIRSRQRFLARLVPAVGLLRVLIPISIALQEFGNADASNRVYPSVLISTDVANDPIEEELRLPISMYSMSIHFRHHKATKVWLGAIGLGCSNFCKVMSMKLAAFFFNLNLEWIRFFSSWRDRSLMIGGGREGTAGAAVEYP